MTINVKKLKKRQKLSKTAKIRDVEIVRIILLHLKNIQKPKIYRNPRGGSLALEAEKTINNDKNIQKKLEKI